MNTEAQFIRELQGAKTRDRAFNKLIDLYQERLYWHVRKIVITHENANDVLQNTFIKIYKGIHNFQANSKLLTWMFRIAYNESLRFLETSKRKATHFAVDIESTNLAALAEDPFFDGEAVKLKLHGLVAQLTDKQRTVFQMKYFDELSFREISEIVQVSESTLKSAYYTAVKFIEEKIIL